MEQFQSLRCQSHPNLIICSVEVSKKCPIESRLACVKCIMMHKSMENFIEINDFLTADLVLLGLKDAMDCNEVPMQILKSQFRHLKLIDDFVKDMMAQITEFRQKIVQKLDLQLDNLKTIEQLRVQYDNALKYMQQKFKQVGELDNNNNNKVRSELEKCVEAYVSLFYKAENQVINEKIHTLKSQAGIIVEQQIFDNFKVSLVKTIGKLSNELSINKLYTILTDTPFGNKLIDSIYDNSKQDIQLVFTGQRDGKNAAAFWNRCENMGPTITICESSSGQIFGGYTPCKWINNNIYEQDLSLKSFLFSVTRQQIYPIINSQNAIMGNINKGPVFGVGCDLLIDQDFQSGYSKLGVSYDTSQYLIEDADTHLMGGKTPALKSIEVYLIE